MAFIIDTINGSGLYAQSAASASVATYDSNGNEITATYLTGVDLTPYQTTAGMTAYATTGDVENKLDASAFNIPASSNWNSTYDTVQSNSANWAGGTIESYNLSAGNYINITKDDVNSAIGIETTGLNVTNWNSNYDTVTANSGAWGGQTLPISAGPGIKLDVVNGTLVASNYFNKIVINEIITAGSYTTGSNTYKILQKTITAAFSATTAYQTGSVIVQGSTQPWSGAAIKWLDAGNSYMNYSNQALLTTNYQLDGNRTGNVLLLTNGALSYRGKDSNGAVPMTGTFTVKWVEQ